MSAVIRTGGEEILKEKQKNYKKHMQTKVIVKPKFNLIHYKYIKG